MALIISWKCQTLGTRIEPWDINPWKSNTYLKIEIQYTKWILLQWPQKYYCKKPKGVKSILEWNSKVTHSYTSLLFRIFAQPLAIAFFSITYLTSFSTLIHILFMHFWRVFLVGMDCWFHLFLPVSTRNVNQRWGTLRSCESMVVGNTGYALEQALEEPFATQMDQWLILPGLPHS